MSRARHEEGGEDEQPRHALLRRGARRGGRKFIRLKRTPSPAGARSGLSMLPGHETRAAAERTGCAPAHPGRSLRLRWWSMSSIMDSMRIGAASPFLSPRRSRRGSSATVGDRLAHRVDLVVHPEAGNALPDGRAGELFRGEAHGPDVEVGAMAKPAPLRLATASGRGWHRGCTSWEPRVRLQIAGDSAHSRIAP